MRRVPELDSVRAFAALAILILHIVGDEPWSFLRGGVDLFFVLSGFLITGIILRNGHQPKFLMRFYARRGLRIWPIYYLTILAVYAARLLRGDVPSLKAFWHHVTYTPHLPIPFPDNGGMSLPELGHVWTLAIEEQFYLTWPALLLLVGGRRAIWAVLGVLAVSPIFREILHGTQIFPRDGGPILLLDHSDGLACGALLAVMLQWAGDDLGRKRQVAWGITVVGLLSLAFGIAIHPRRELLSVALTCMMIVGLTALWAGSPKLRWLRWQPLVYTGNISYGLYLYSWILYEYLDTVVKFGMGLGDAWWLQVLKLVLTFVVAAASWKWIEEPILRLKDRFEYHRPVAPPVAEAAAERPHP